MAARFSSRFLVIVAALGLGLAFCPYALAQVDLGGGKSMMGDLGFLRDLGSTSQDIMFLIAKLLGAGLVLIGVKSVGQRNWEYAVPQLVGGAGLFFVPQIVAAFAKMAGG